MGPARGDTDQRSRELHRRLRGKLRTEPATDLTEETLELIYTPGGGAISRVIAEDSGCAAEFTGIRNSVAIVSDGPAVLGLEAILPPVLDERVAGAVAEAVTSAGETASLER